MVVDAIAIAIGIRAAIVVAIAIHVFGQRWTRIRRPLKAIAVDIGWPNRWREHGHCGWFVRRRCVCRAACQPVTPPAHVDRARLPAISYRLRAIRFLPPPKIQYAHRNRRGSPRRYQLQVRRLPTGRCAFERAFQRAPALSPRIDCRARHHGAIARHTRCNDCRYGQDKVGLSEFITPHNARAIEHRACWVRSLPADSPTSKSHVSRGASFCQV